MKRILLAIVLLVTSQAHAWDLVHFNELLDKTEQLYTETSCSGGDCITLWNNQIAFDIALSDMIATLPVKGRINSSYGAKARQISFRICHNQRTGFGSFGIDLINRANAQENRLLALLAGLQKQSGMNPLTCKVDWTN